MLLRVEHLVPKEDHLKLSKGLSNFPELCFIKTICKTNATDFSTDDRRAVQALDRSNGTSYWKQDRLFLRQLTVPFPLGRQIAVVDIEGQVHFMDRESGALVGRVPTDPSGAVAPPVALPTGFLVQTRNGGLHAIALQP